MNKLIKYFEQEGIPYNSMLLEKFSGYMEDILEKNKSINLTAITEKEEFVIKHYLDSVMAARCPEYVKATKVMDLGTGAGFPGIPLALISPDKDFTLVDSLNKKLKIISELCEKYEINNVYTVHGRAEELSKNKEYRETFDLCVSRAVANIATLSEYCLPFIKVGGNLICYKGPEALKELETAKKAIALLGGKLVRVDQGNLSEYGISHNMVIIYKKKKTPTKYPRKAGMPSKEPLI